MQTSDAFSEGKKTTARENLKLTSKSSSSSLFKLRICAKYVYNPLFRILYTHLPATAVVLLLSILSFRSHCCCSVLNQVKETNTTPATKKKTRTAKEEKRTKQNWIKKREIHPRTNIFFWTEGKMPEPYKNVNGFLFCSFFSRARQTSSVWKHLILGYCWALLWWLPTHWIQYSSVMRYEIVCVCVAGFFSFIRVQLPQFCLVIQYILMTTQLLERIGCSYCVYAFKLSHGLNM